MIEMLCALALFSIIGAALVHAYSTIIHYQLYSLHRHYASSLARTVIEKARIKEWPIGLQQHQGYDVLVVIEPYKKDIVSLFNQITVTISWIEHGSKEKRNVVFSSGMMRDEK